MSQILPRDLHRQAVALIDQQMWCWGCDARYSGGNLLIAQGLARHPYSGGGQPRPSAYSQPLADGRACITLWGFGLWASHRDHGSLYVSRASLRLRYTPQVIAVPTAWAEADLPPTQPPAPAQTPQARALLRLAFGWIADYERTLGERTPAGYRERACAQWPQRRRLKGVPAAELSQAWQALAGALAG